MIEARLIDDDGRQWRVFMIPELVADLHVAVAKPISIDEYDEAAKYAPLTTEQITFRLEKVYGIEDGGPFAVYRYHTKFRA